MFDYGAILKSWYRGNKNRFETANPLEQVISPYDSPTSLVQDMISRGIMPWRVQTINLSTAGELVLNIPGYHFVMYGHDNSANKAVNTQAYVEVFFGKDKVQAGNGFPAKHARGLSGVFTELTIKWPAQSGVYADLVIHTGMFQPWIDGEAAT